MSENTTNSGNTSTTTYGNGGTGGSFANVSGCPGITPPSADIGTNLAREKDFVKSLGVTKCKTASDKQSWSESSSGWLSGSSSASGAADPRSTVGCAGLNLLMQNHINCTNAVTCILNTTTNDITTKVNPINSIDFVGNITFNCGNQSFNISQTSSVNMKIITNIGTSAVQKISHAIQASIGALSNDLQNTNKGQPEYSKDGAGTKTVNTINDQNTSSSINASVQTTINSILNSVTSGNTLTIGNPGSTFTVNANGCNITQNSHIDLIASNIVNNAYNTAFATTSLVAAMPVIIGSPVVAKKSSMLLIVGIIAAVLILGFCIYYFYFLKRKAISPRLKYRLKYRF